MSSWFHKHRHLYPPDWDAIAARVKDRAGRRCQACGTPHGPVPDVLTVDHCVDSSPANCAADNLLALCQVCHLRRQGLRPRPRTALEALGRLKARLAEEYYMMPFPGF